MTNNLKKDSLKYVRCGFFCTKYEFYSHLPSPITIYLDNHEEDLLTLFSEELDSGFKRLAPYLEVKKLWDKSFYSQLSNMGGGAGFVSEDKDLVCAAFDARYGSFGIGNLEQTEKIVLVNSADAVRAAIEFEELIIKVFKNVETLYQLKLQGRA